MPINIIRSATAKDTRFFSSTTFITDARDKRCVNPHHLLALRAEDHPRSMPGFRGSFIQKYSLEREKSAYPNVCDNLVNRRFVMTFAIQGLWTTLNDDGSGGKNS